MTYRNKKSGVTFVTPCACEGEDWEEVKASAPKARDEQKQEAADAQSADSAGESKEEAKASAPTSKAKRGKKQEPAADVESADSGGEDS